MAISDYYVDPSIAANSGTGTSVDPYGDLQYALNTVTQNTTDGDRFNIKAGTAEILSASLSLTTYGTPSWNYPLIFQGYTSSQGDGGRGAIDCNTYTAITNAGDGIGWYEIDFTGGPATAATLSVSARGAAIRCKVSGADGYGIAAGGNEYIIADNEIIDVGGASYDGILAGSYAEGSVIGNYIKQGGTRTMRAGIRLSSGLVNVENNIISIDSSSDGIYASGGFPLHISGNTILSSLGTGEGINISGASSLISLYLVNNYIEGFSGVGGNGMAITASSAGSGIYGHNAYYNNTTNETISFDSMYLLGDNETLIATGLAKSGADTYANRFVYFAPVDTGNMQSGGFPEA